MGCNYLSMLGLKLDHVSKRGLWSQQTRERFTVLFTKIGNECIFHSFVHWYIQWMRFSWFCIIQAFNFITGWLMTSNVFITTILLSFLNGFNCTFQTSSWLYVNYVMFSIDDAAPHYNLYNWLLGACFSGVGYHYFVYLLILLLISIIMVISSYTDIFMSMATPFELQI